MRWWWCPSLTSIAPSASTATWGGGSTPTSSSVSWLLQEVKTRLPGREDPIKTTFDSASDLAKALQRAAAAHGEHEERTGQADPDWPDWYAKGVFISVAGRQPGGVIYETYLVA
jgi:hypothetical protein